MALSRGYLNWLQSPDMNTGISAEIWTVAQLTRRIKALLEKGVGYVWVGGEISNWKLAASGHAYFTLKDQDSQIDGVMFRMRMSKLKFRPDSGIEVLVYGQVSVYEKRGTYQIVVEEMQPKGVGALQLAYEQLRKKLEAEGLFAEEHKKPLPLLPRKIGIVTSPTGAAIRDMLHVLDRRFANIHVLLFPARVQGEGAAKEIARGIETLDRLGMDVIIIGRGGGSLEDLWAFNEEVVVRAVFAAQTPIISAVGHEVDFSLSDFAADLRAPTPSAAAELVVREQAALLEKVRLLERRMARAGRGHFRDARHRLQMLTGSYVFRRPEELVRQRRQQVDELRMRLEDGAGDCLHDRVTRLQRAQRALKLLSPQTQFRHMRERLGVLRGRLLNTGGINVERNRARLATLSAQLDALSPLAILSRGYALTWKEPEHTLLRSAAEVRAGNEIYVRLGAGALTATVLNTEEIAEHGPDAERKRA